MKTEHTTDVVVLDCTEVPVEPEKNVPEKTKWNILTDEKLIAMFQLVLVTNRTARGTRVTTWWSK